jgi:hypothetical protein
MYMVLTFSDMEGSYEYSASVSAVSVVLLHGVGYGPTLFSKIRVTKYDYTAPWY